MAAQFDLLELAHQILGEAGNHQPPPVRAHRYLCQRTKAAATPWNQSRRAHRNQLVRSRLSKRLNQRGIVPERPLLSPVESVHPGETRPVRQQDPARIDDRPSPVTSDEADPAPFQEISGGIPDRVTHNYMDYGQFEHPPSPATEAVKKVKRKIIAREEQEKPRHLLD